MKFFAGLFVAFCLFTLRLNAAVLTNGGLELLPGDNFKTVLPGASYAGWRCDGPGDIEFLAQASFSPVAQRAGAVDLNGINYEGSISQSITMPGFVYQLRFAMSGNPGGPGQPDLVTKTMNVLWDGANVGSFAFVHQPGDLQTSLRWEYHQVLVTGTGSNLLTFASTIHDKGGGPVLDDVSLTGVAPTVSIRVSQVQICWDSMTNLNYQVEFRSALTSNSWIPLGGSISGNGSRLCVQDAIVTGQPQKFYRVQATP